jgi:hypothetical protein
MNGRWRLESKLHSKLKIMTSRKSKTMWLTEINKFLEVEEGLWNWWYSKHLPRRPMVHLTHLINHCIRLSHFPTSLKEAKVVILPKPGKDPKIPQNLCLISLLPLIDKLFENILLQIVQKRIGGKNLLNASQFGFHACHSTTLQCMRLADHVTLNFNNKMSTNVVLLDNKKAFDTTSHHGLLYKLLKLNFSTRIIKLISSFLLQRKFRVSVEGEMSMSRCMQAEIPRGSYLFPTLYNLYINDTSQI